VEERLDRITRMLEGLLTRYKDQDIKRMEDDQANLHKKWKEQAEGSST